MSDMRTVEEHLADILGAVSRLPAQTLPLADAHGFTLAAPVHAAISIPAFDNAAMDGFAVRFDDVVSAGAASPVRLTVVADLPAGSPDDPRIRAGEAARIMTGAAVPADADAIVPFEDTLGGLADSLGVVDVVRSPSARGAFVRRAAQDVTAGAEVLAAGTSMGAFQRSAAAAAGVAEVVVARRPRVAVVSTGSELVAPGSRTNRGQIPDSNGILLESLAIDAGAVVVHRGVVDDDGAALRTLVETLHGIDAVVFSGGVSAGAYEVVRSELSGSMAFVRVAMQPGKPQGFGRITDGPLLFGLPGNPVSSAVSFEVFVRPALLAMQGATQLHRPVLRLAAGTAWTPPPARRQYLPAVVDRTDAARWTVAPATAGGSGSHLAGGLGRAEAYAIVPAGVDAVEVGDALDVMLIA